MSTQQPGAPDEAIVAQQLARRFADVSLFDNVAADELESVVRVAQRVILARCEANPQFGYQVMRNLATSLALRNRLTALSIQAAHL